MNNPCEWCKSTSDQIDSLEYQLEAKDKENLRLLRNRDRQVEILEAKDKVIAELHNVLHQNYKLNRCQCGCPDCLYCDNSQDVGELLQRVAEKCNLLTKGD